MPDPRLWLLSRPCAYEVPLEQLAARRGGLSDVDEAEPSAVEVAPGVRVACLGTGDHMIADGTLRQGALIAVWADLEFGARYAISECQSETPLPDEVTARSMVVAMRVNHPGWDARLVCREAARPAGPWREAPDGEVPSG